MDIIINQLGVILLKFYGRHFYCINKLCLKKKKKKKNKIKIKKIKKKKKKKKKKK